MWVMQPRRESFLGRGRTPAPAMVRVAARALLGCAVLSLAATGCGRSGPGAARVAAHTPLRCGTSLTAAAVKVDVEVVHGSVACSAALAIEHDYAKAIMEGKAPGAGGGGPVQVRGWKCQGYATPYVDATGKASRCVKAGTEILAVLPPVK